MKITSRGRYALRFMIDIAENCGNGSVAIKDVSMRQNISVKYLEQIAPHLTRKNLLRGVRGPLGGYTLVKSVEEYTAGEIIRATEGKLAPVACLEDDENPCERSGFCPTLNLWKDLHRTVNEYLDSVTLSDLTEGKFSTLHQRRLAKNSNGNGQ